RGSWTDPFPVLSRRRVRPAAWSARVRCGTTRRLRDRGGFKPGAAGRALDAAHGAPGGDAVTTRIGVVSDTHCPEFLDRLPDRLFDVLRGVDLILHAGDVNGKETIGALAGIAPVEAVRGDHDDEAIGLPLSREAAVEARGLVI